MKPNRKVKKGVQRKPAPKKKTASKKVVVSRETKPRIETREMVVTSPVDPSAQIIVASELADDALIEAELMGEILPHYIYQFCENRPACKDMSKCTHRKTTGMSVKGINEMVRRLNRDKKSGYNIRIKPEHLKIERDVVENGVKGVAVTVYAENLLDGNSAFGTKFEPYQKSGKNGSYANTFATEKALSKAERNAKRKLIPETVAVKMVEKILKGNPSAVQTLAPVDHTHQTVVASKVAPTSQEELENMVRDGIRAARTVGHVMEFDKKVAESDKFSPKFKKEIRQLASERVDQLQSK